MVLRKQSEWTQHIVAKTEEARKGYGSQIAITRPQGGKAIARPRLPALSDRKIVFEDLTRRRRDLYGAIKETFSYRACQNQNGTVAGYLRFNPFRQRSSYELARQVQPEEQHSFRISALGPLHELRPVYFRAGSD